MLLTLTGDLKTQFPQKNCWDRAKRWQKFQEVISCGVRELKLNRNLRKFLQKIIMRYISSLVKKTS